MKHLSKYVIFSIVMLFILIGCKENTFNPEYEYLKGTWVDKESFALQFIDFYSEDQARFGMYSKNFEKYDPFYYRIIEPNQIAIDFIGDNDSTETLHDLIKVGDDIIEISDLTVIPENPNKVYLRREILTETVNDTIVIGHNQIYFDFENHFRLELDSVLSDSRCPTGGICVWEGNAEVHLDLITDGNTQHIFTLNTYRNFRQDTVINNIKYKLVGVTPYPDNDKTSSYSDYKARIIIEKQ